MSNDPNTEAEFIVIGQLSAADFESHLNTEFVVDLNYCGIDLDGAPVQRDDAYPAEASLQLELVEVEQRKPASPYTRQDPFTLLFRGPHELPLFCENHVLSHETLGKLSVFLGPVNAFPGIRPETHPDGRFYECIVN